MRWRWLELLACGHGAFELRCAVCGDTHVLPRELLELAQGAAERLELVLRLGRQSGAVVHGRITRELDVDFTITFPKGGTVTGGTHGRKEEAAGEDCQDEAGEGGAQAGSREDEQGPEEEDLALGHPEATEGQPGRRR
jgi:hypothetical protein